MELCILKINAEYRLWVYYTPVIKQGSKQINSEPNAIPRKWERTFGEMEALEEYITEAYLRK